MSDDSVVISVQNLKKYFEVRAGLMKSLVSKEVQYVHAVDDVSFEIHKGETLGLVGESGCGKSTTGRLLTRLEDPTDGHMYFRGEDIAGLHGKELKEFRRNVQMIFQDPYESLNPRFTVYNAISEPLVVHGIGDTYEEREDLVVRALEKAEMKPAEKYLKRFPHELSGGQRQRIAIARALVINPEFVVADEPVSMLDVSIRAGIMNLLLKMKKESGIPFVFVTHDVSVSRYMSDRIAVMYLGSIVEIGPAEEVIHHPKHPYTKALISAVPVPDPHYKRGRTEIIGDLPSPINLPKGCKFHPRCIYAQPKCREETPPWTEVKPGHFVLCHYPDNLQMSVSKEEVFGEDNKDLPVCRICFKPIGDDQKVQTCPICGAEFHDFCAAKVHECPVCGAELK